MIAKGGGGLDSKPSTGPLRIAQVNDIAAVGSTLARCMTELGHQASLVEPRRLATRLHYPWKIASLPFRAAGILAAGASLRRGRFDVVHVHFARLGMLGAMSGRPYTLHLHGTDIRGVRPDSWWGRETAPFLRQARLVYYSTPDLRPWVETFRSDAILLPNPIETDRFRPLAADDPARAVRRDLLVGTRLTPIKGLATILEVLRLLAIERPAMTITIVYHGVGVGPDGGAAGPNATVVPKISRAELPNVMRQHRLALGQFRLGIVSNFELEALASGVPVIMRFDPTEAYAAPPPLASAASAEEAATRIGDLLDDEEARDELARLASAWVEANHAATVVAARVIDDYRRTGQTPG
jgi:glycosyltransferase involved in cell wall biosynthesis